MAHFDKNGFAVRKDGTPFERKNDGVIIATEEDHQELFKTFRDSDAIKKQVTDLAVKLAFEEEYSFDQMMIIRHIIIPIARDVVESRLRDQVESLREDQDYNEQIIAKLKTQIEELEKKVPRTDTEEETDNNQATTEEQEEDD